MFKNNSPFPYNVMSYISLDHVFGSDHRPIILSLRISFAHAQEEQKLEDAGDQRDLKTRIRNLMNFRPMGVNMDLNLNQIMQTYGVIKFKFLQIFNLRLPSQLYSKVLQEYKK